MENIASFLFQLFVLIFSVVIHEVSHGLMANRLGDPTAKYEGRLTLNPIKHFDLFGSFIVPFGLYFLSGGKAVFGWAKPVPYNPYNLRDQRWGPALVAAAGPAMNILVAVVFGLIIRFLGASFSLEKIMLNQFVDAGLVSSSIFIYNFIQLLSFVVLLNLVLGFFNLMPIPPIDGSKILFAFLPYSLRRLEDILETYGMLIILLIVFVLFDYFFPIILFIYRFLTGMPFLV